MKQADWAIKNQKFEYAEEVIEEGLTKIKQRNKLVKLSDTSDGGWETVKQYQANQLASDSEDEKKYRRQSIELPRKKT